MYIIKREHDIPYFVNKSDHMLSWSSNKNDAYPYHTFVGAMIVIVALKYITGDNSIVVTKEESN
jgi:hypothetical protein